MQAIADLASNEDAMRVASPGQKAQLIRLLQKGWTKDSQDMAIARILMSCESKAEFDKVVDMAGGRKIVDDIDHEEAKSAVNKLMGGFDRVDCADDRATAESYRDALLPPAVHEYARSHVPGDAQLDGVLGRPPYSAQDFDDPAVAAKAREHQDARRQFARQAYEVQGDPTVRNQLALKNREREMSGQPPLEYSRLVDRAYEVANDPAFLAETNAAIADAERRLGRKLSEEQKQEVREKALEQRLGAVAREYGVSEQELKTLVVAKMGRLMQEGARLEKSLGHDLVWGTMFRRIAEIERTEGADSPKARRLREQVSEVGSRIDAQAARLHATGVTAAAVFKVPPSFAEDFVKAMRVIGDVLAAAVNLIPGVGQAISATYFGVKAIVCAAAGELLDAFKSLLSAVSGFAGVIATTTHAVGAAKDTLEAIGTVAKGIQTGVSGIQGIVEGDGFAIVGALGSAGGMAVKDLSWIGPPSRLDPIELGVWSTKLLPQAAGTIDGIVRGDGDAVLEGLGGMLDELEDFDEQHAKFERTHVEGRP
jgi:hypothetical protein